MDDSLQVSMPTRELGVQKDEDIIKISELSPCQIRSYISIRGKSIQYPEYQTNIPNSRPKTQKSPDRTRPTDHVRHSA